MISYLDEQVGELVSVLKQTGQYENTIIIFTSDNGPSYVQPIDLNYFESTSFLNNDPCKELKEKFMRRYKSSNDSSLAKKY